MRIVYRIGIALAALLVASQLPASSAQADSRPPFVVTSSTGPAAGSRIIATVTRTIAKTPVTLPAALVPALKPGDIIDLDFPDYRRPPGIVNYHVNAAFITETPPQHWLFPRSERADRLFGFERGKPKTGTIHFVYGAGDARGIPVFFLIPEDAKTRGVDGVRDYVAAHPSDFVAMAQGTNTAANRYTYLTDFLLSLGNGSIDPVSARNRVESAAQSFGVSAATIDACYAAGGTKADVTNCIQQSINAVMYQTDFSAPTQAEFLGGIAGAASPLMVAPYISSLVSVWHLFLHVGHQEYEYLPTTIGVADPSQARADELLMGLKVATIRPPAAYSDVLFFTIGDPQAAANVPTIVNDAPPAGVCERDDRFALPVHLDKMAAYVNDPELLVTPDGRAPYRIPLDPRTLAAPSIDRGRFTASADGGYTVALTARFGFDAVSEPAQRTMRLAFPSELPWSVAPLPYHPPTSGSSLDIVAASASAACLSRAELQIGSAPPIPLAATHLDAKRVELRASLANVPAGPAEIRFFEDDPTTGRELESASAVAIQPPPSHVDTKSAVAHLGDDFVGLSGTRFERIRGIRVNGIDYTKEAGSTSTAACFDGPPLNQPDLVPGEVVSAQLLASGNSPGEVFPLTILAPRPSLAVAAIDGSSSSPYLSTQTLRVRLDAPAGFPSRFTVRVRQSQGARTTPCFAQGADATAVTVPEETIHRLSPTAVAFDFQSGILCDRSFGALEMQVVDADTGSGSRWVPVPGSFARAPSIAKIACSADATPCRMYGTNLGVIDAVQSDAGTFTPPGLDCSSTEKGLACIVVPHATHYVVRLIDGAVLEPLPDRLIETPPAVKSAAMH